MNFEGFDYATAFIENENGMFSLSDDEGRYVSVALTLAHVERRAAATLPRIPLFLLRRQFRSIDLWTSMLGEDELVEIAEQLDITTLELSRHLLGLIDCLVWFVEDETKGFFTGWARASLENFLPPSLRRPLDDKAMREARTAACRFCFLPMQNAKMGRPRLYCTDTCRKAANRRSRNTRSFTRPA